MGCMGMEAAADSCLLRQSEGLPHLSGLAQAESKLLLIPIEVGIPQSSHLKSWTAIAMYHGYTAMDERFKDSNAKMLTFLGI